MELIKIEDFYRPGYQVHAILEYNLYRLIEEERIYPYKLLNKWIYNNHYIRKNSKELRDEEYICLKQVDEPSFNSLYNRLYNPIILRIFLPIGQKVYKSNKLIYHFEASLTSIDDASYGVRFEFVDYDKAQELRDKLFDYVESKDIINYKEFIDFGLSLGGIDNSN